MRKERDEEPVARHAGYRRLAPREVHEERDLREREERNAERKRDGVERRRGAGDAGDAGEVAQDEVPIFEESQRGQVAADARGEPPRSAPAARRRDPAGNEVVARDGREEDRHAPGVPPPVEKERGE